MQRYIDLFQRARQKPLRYLVWKGTDLLRQRLRRWWERNGGYELSDRHFLRLLRCQSAAEAIATYLNPDRARFFVAPDSKAHIASLVRELDPEGAEETVRRAQAVLRHEVDLLGSGPVSLGSRIDWHCDFKTGRRWPVTHFAAIEYNNLDEPSDVKVPWELSRGHQLVTLGRAWCLTGNEEYPREFAAQIESWLAENPTAMGVNWACTMDVAIRAVNWIWAAFLMRDAELPEAFWLRLLKALYQHGRFITNHLEYSDVNGNHYLADGAGLVYLGLLFRDLPEGQRWLDKGREIVHGEVFKQVFPDGVDFEMATAYHRLCTELFLSPFLWELRCGLPVPQPVLERLRAMLEYIRHYTRPDGTAPNIGDADDGRLHVLGNQPIQDHRYLLAIGAVLFNDSDLKAAADRFWEEALWMTGTAGYDAFQALPQGSRPSSRAFDDGGFFIMREKNYHLIVDCGDIGLAGRGGHGHNDVLSFELAAGRPVIVDPGAYTYTADWQAREKFRSTAFHNTVQVDGQEINRLGGKGKMWTMYPDARPIVRAWESTPAQDRFVGEHTGYTRLPDPVRHVREIIFAKQPVRWEITDTLTGTAAHSLKGYFHLHPEVQVIAGDSCYILSGPGRVSLKLEWKGPEDIVWSVEDGWYSPSYGVRQPTKVLVWNWAGVLPANITVMLQPLSEAEGENPQ